MKSFREYIQEDAPTNAVGGGAIAGANGDPPVRKRQKKKQEIHSPAFLITREGEVKRSS